MRFRPFSSATKSSPILSPDQITVSGERYHNSTIEKLIKEHGQGKLTWRTTAKITREITNEIDPFAVQVLVDGQRVGYIHRDHCKSVWGIIGDAGLALECSVRWNGEPTNGVYDVKLFPPL